MLIIILAIVSWLIVSAVLIHLHREIRTAEKQLHTVTTKAAINPTTKVAK